MQNCLRFYNIYLHVPARCWSPKLVNDSYVKRSIQYHTIYGDTAGKEFALQLLKAAKIAIPEKQVFGMYRHSALSSIAFMFLIL